MHNKLCKWSHNSPPGDRNQLLAYMLIDALSCLDEKLDALVHLEVVVGSGGGTYGANLA